MTIFELIFAILGLVIGYCFVNSTSALVASIIGFIVAYLILKLLERLSNE